MLIVLDGTNLVRRQYHAGGSGSLSRTVAALRHQYGGEVVIAWDAKQPYWRHELYADYKAKRADDPQAAAFVRAAAKDARTEGLLGYYADKMEADDVAATLVRNTNDETIVVTSDKDWCQLIAEGARWLSPHNGTFEERDETWVWEHFKVGPGAWPDFVALAGDPSDGIPGMPRIGQVRAAKLLAEFGTAEAWAMSLDEAGAAVAIDQVKLWKQLASLRDDAELKTF